MPPPPMMRTPGPGNVQAILGNWPGENDINPDPAGTVGASAMHQGGNRMPLALPPQPQSWGLQNPALPSQLNTWLRNYYGGVGQLDPQMLDALVQQARAGFTWDAAHATSSTGETGIFTPTAYDFTPIGGPKVSKGSATGSLTCSIFAGSTLLGTVTGNLHVNG